jgi:hypothetical protein
VAEHLLRTAGKSILGAPGIRADDRGRAINPWREVQREDVGEGFLTGHSISRDLMAFARANPEEARSLIEATIKSAVLDAVHGDTDEDFEGRNYAAMAFLADMSDFLTLAAASLNLEPTLAEGEAYARRHVEAMRPLNTKKRLERKSRPNAKDVLAKAMRREPPRKEADHG